MDKNDDGDEYDVLELEQLLLLTFCLLSCCFFHGS